MTLCNWRFVLWWLSESDAVALFPPLYGQVTPPPSVAARGTTVRGRRRRMRREKKKKEGGGGGRRRRLEKLCCWYLPCVPPWEPHVKTDTCSLTALSQGPGRVRVCLYDSKLLGEPLIWVCGTVLVQSPTGNKLQGAPPPDKHCRRRRADGKRSWKRAETPWERSLTLL